MPSPRLASGECYEKKSSNRADNNGDGQPAAEMRIRLRQAEHVDGRIRTMKKIVTCACGRRRIRINLVKVQTVLGSAVQGWAGHRRDTSTVKRARRLKFLILRTWGQAPKPTTVEIAGEAFLVDGELDHGEGDDRPTK
jgi:hypothetical protein